MNACFFNMFHDPANENVSAVSKGVNINFCGMAEKAVNEDRVFT